MCQMRDVTGFPGIFFLQKKIDVAHKRLKKNTGVNHTTVAKRHTGAQIEPKRKKRVGEQVALAFPRTPRALECNRALISTTPQPMKQKFNVWIHEKFKSLCQMEALPKIASLSYIHWQSGLMLTLDE